MQVVKLFWHKVRCLLKVCAYLRSGIHLSKKCHFLKENLRVLWQSIKIFWISGFVVSLLDDIIYCPRCELWLAICGSAHAFFAFYSASFSILCFLPSLFYLFAFVWLFAGFESPSIAIHDYADPFTLKSTKIQNLLIRTCAMEVRIAVVKRLLRWRD